MCAPEFNGATVEHLHLQWSYWSTIWPWTWISICLYKEVDCGRANTWTICESFLPLSTILKKCCWRLSPTASIERAPFLLWCRSILIYGLGTCLKTSRVARIFSNCLQENSISCKNSYERFIVKTRNWIIRSNIWCNKNLQHSLTQSCKTPTKKITCIIYS